MTCVYTMISEETLEQLVCSNCNNYLSYGDPKIGSKKIICGRCNQKEVFLPLFNENIRNYLFPCINRFDGCKQLLYHSQIREHEQKCKSFARSTCTECKYSGNGCQLYHHYLKNHPNNLLREPSFKIQLLEAVTHNYLFRKNNNLFIVTYEIIKPECVLKLNIENVGKIVEPNPQYQFIIKSFLKEQQCYKSEYKCVLAGDSIELDIFQLIKEHKEKNVLCCLNINVGGELFFVSVNDQKIGPKPILSPPKETKQLQEKENQLKSIMDALHTNLFPKLQCSSCHCYVVPPIYRCLSNHVKCEDDDCSGSFCNLCDDITNWSPAIDLEVFHDVVPLPCRWNCKNMFLSAKLREHEKHCSERRYSCVEKWCSWRGSLDNLIKHWHSSAPLFKQGYQPQVYGFREELVEFYSIFNKEVFYWRMDPLRVEGRNIHVRKVSDVSSKEAYSARVLLTHKCDDVRKEKLSFVKLGGITLLDRSYFTYFGKCKNYKICFFTELLS